MIKRLWCSVLAILLASSSGFSQSDARSDPDLKAGVSALDDGRLDAAAESFERAVARLVADPKRTAEAAQALLYLGITRAGLEQTPEAKRQFIEALRRNWTLHLDPNRYPPKIIQVFDAARAEARAAGLEPKQPGKKAGIGGLGVGAIVIGVLAAGGAAAAAAGGGDNATTSTAATTIATTTTTTTTTTLASTNRPPNLIFSASPTRGAPPLAVGVDMCQSSDPDGTRLSFSYNWGDGTRESGDCSRTHVYTAVGTYRAEGCVRDAQGSGDVCQSVQIRVEEATPTPPPGGYKIGAPTRLTWQTQMNVPGGRGQVVLNGIAASFPGRGHSQALGEAQADNRIEAQLVQGRGEPGTWKFDFSEAGRFVWGSIQVLAGEVVETTPESVTFRIKGTPGERVVFVFKGW